MFYIFKNTYLKSTELDKGDEADSLDLYFADLFYVLARFEIGEPYKLFGLRPFL